MIDYREFLNNKSQSAWNDGFSPIWIPDFLFDFQKSLTEWSITKGRCAEFADCGLGKTPMQLVWAENVLRHTNKPVLVLTPLAVSHQTVNEGEKFNINVQRSPDGTVRRGAINVTNYERLHYFNPADFSGVVCDESSILKSFDGAYRKEITEFMRKVRYRLLCTATAAPNDYIELGTSSEALGELGYTDMLTRFFKNDQNTIKAMRFQNQLLEGAKWRFKGHAEQPFWRWVCSWARAIRKPSDLGFDDDGFILPPLTETEHIVTAEKLAPGFLFAIPAVGLKEQRQERRRTVEERCQKAADLVAARPDEHSIVWCQLNDEGDLLEELIPRAIQVSGSDSDDWKEMAALWFVGKKCICNEPLFRAKLTTWRKDLLATGNSIIKIIANSCLIGQSDTLRNTEKRISNTTPNITNQIKENGCAPPKNLQSEIENDANSMPLTKSSDSQKSMRSSDIGINTPMHDLIDSCENMVSPLPNITPMNPPVAQSADGNKTAIPGGTGCTSTTAMKQENSEGSCAQIVTLDSESSEMMQSYLKEPPCICGHETGKRVLITKSKIFGLGLNFQSCSHIVTFPSHSYEQYYQSVRRCWRFGQTHPVTVDIITTEGEIEVLKNLQRKSRAADKMFSSLVAFMNESIKIDRGRDFTESEKIPSWLSQNSTSTDSMRSIAETA